MKKFQNVLFLLALITFTSCNYLNTRDDIVAIPQTENIDGQVVMTIHVSPDGKDSYKTPGTKSRPLRSIQYALSRTTVDWREDSDKPDILRILVQQGVYTPGNGLVTTNMGVAVHGGHTPLFFGEPKLIIEGGYDRMWNRPAYGNRIDNPERVLSVLDGEDILQHVLYVNRSNVEMRGFVIKGGNARNTPIGAEAEFTTSYMANLWKYGGGLFAVLHSNTSLTDLYFQENRADYSGQGLAAIFNQAAQSSGGNAQIYTAPGQTVAVTHNFGTRLVVLPYDADVSGELSSLDVFVSTSGNDNADGSKEAPFLSIQNALESAFERANAMESRPDTIRINVQQGLYQANQGLRNGNIGFILSGLTYENSNFPFIEINGGLNSEWQKPNYDVQTQNPAEDLSVLDGNGDMQHVAVISRPFMKMQGFLIKGGNVNDNPTPPVETVPGTSSVHLWRYGGGVLLLVGNGSFMDAMYFEDNKADFSGAAKAIAFIKPEDSAITNYSYRIYLGPDQNHGATSNFVSSRLTVISYGEEDETTTSGDFIQLP